MTDREQEFITYSNLNFSELVKIKFKSGAQPRNATDHYYHSKTKTIYSYYFGGDSGRWEANVKINSDNIKSPSELSTSSEKAGLKNHHHFKIKIRKRY